MKKYYVLTFLFLTMLFNNKVGECALYELDLKGSITSWSLPSPTIEELLGVSIGSKMKSSFIYNTDPYLAYSSEVVDLYRMSPLVLNFQGFTVYSGSSFVMFKETGDIIYGSTSGGILLFENGGGLGLEESYLHFYNKSGTSYTLESFPTVLNRDNFDIRFVIHGYLRNYPDYPGVTLSYGFGGDIDKVKIHPVPEPSTLLLMGCGLVGLAVLGRKKLK